MGNGSRAECLSSLGVEVNMGDGGKHYLLVMMIQITARCNIADSSMEVCLEATLS